MTLSTMGLFGFGVLIWMLVHFIGMAGGLFAAGRDSNERGSAYGLCGSLGTGIIIGVFYPFMYGVSAVAFVLVLSLIYVLSTGTAENRGDSGSPREMVPEPPRK
jgi:hypothetical protein